MQFENANYGFYMNSNLDVCCAYVQEFCQKKSFFRHQGECGYLTQFFFLFVSKMVIGVFNINVYVRP